MRKPKPAHVPTADEIQALRARHGLSQSGFAAALAPAGISVRTVQGWESGKRMPAATWRYMLAQLGELTLPE